MAESPRLSMWKPVEKPTNRYDIEWNALCDLDELYHQMMSYVLDHDSDVVEKIVLERFAKKVDECKRRILWNADTNGARIKYGDES